MSRAIQLARLGQFTTHPNPRVGCVITKDERLVASGWHKKAGLPHAEINAINHAPCELHGATMYVSLEPCHHQGKTPPCTERIIDAGISRVVIAMRDPNPVISGAGLDALANAGIHVELGLMEREARKLNQGFIYRMTRQRPYIRCKLAISLDGKIALANGKSKWLSGEPARLDVQRLRARSSAVITGINTVLADDPRLNVREVDTQNRQPHRVILDRSLRFPESAKMLESEGKVIVFTRDHHRETSAALKKAGVIVERADCPESEFLHFIVNKLAQTYAVNDLLIEAGATLSGSMLNSGLIDELIIYQAPVILGTGSVDMIKTPVLNDLHQRYRLNMIDSRKMGADWRFIFKPSAS